MTSVDFLMVMMISMKSINKFNAIIPLVVSRDPNPKRTGNRTIAITKIRIRYLMRSGVN